MWAIFRKELFSHFTGYTNYIVGIVFMLASGLLLWVMENPFNILQLGKSSLELFFELSPWLLTFLVPAITMGSISEETSNGTLEWLFTQPISTKEIVLGKFLALKVLLFFILCPTLFYLYSRYNLSLPVGNIDIGHLLTGYFGVYLISVLFAAIGVFCSSISKNQLVAFLLGLFICFLLFFGIKGIATFDLLNENDYLVRKIGIGFHYNNFIRGIIDTRSVFYFYLLAVIFLLMADSVIAFKKK